MKYIVAIALLVFKASALAIEVEDDRGNSIYLEQPAKRVVALAPHLVEIVFAVGRGETLKGVVSYSDFPEEAKKIPQVGSYKSFSVESILRMQPDLILGWSSGNGEEKIKALEALGLKVYRNEPRSLLDVKRSLHNVSVLLGSENPGEAAEQFEQTYKQLQQTYAHKKPINMFYEVWNKPLQTLNGEHLISDVMKLCGGVNVFADEPTLAPKLSIESVLHADPQVILASGMGVARPEWLDEWLDWPQLQAVKNQQLYFIPPDLLQRHTPRVLEGAALMCEQLEKAREVY